MIKARRLFQSVEVASGMIAALMLAAGAAGAGDYKAPRTAYGAPDLEGVWTNLSLTDLERPDDLKVLAPTAKEVAEFERLQNDPDALDALEAAKAKKAGKPPRPNVGQTQSEFPDANLKFARVRGEPRSSFLVEPDDGKLPYTDAAKAMVQARRKASARNFDNPEDRPLNERCLATLSSGPPLNNPGFNADFEIVQTRDQVAIVAEMSHDLRIVELGGGLTPVSAPARWMGHSAGRWDGRTLVVETQGFEPREFPRNGVVLSDHARVEERFTRTAPDTILYTFTVVDPVNYSRTWRGEMELKLARADAFKEYACHEGNYSLPGILAGARQAEREGRTPEALDGG